MLAGVTLNTGLLGSLLLTMLATLGLLIKKWPDLKALTISEQAQLREDRRSDYRELKNEFADLKTEMEALKLDLASKEQRITVSETHSAAVTLRVSQLEFVFRMVMDEFDQVAPGNAVAKRAKDLVAAMTPLPSPGSDELRERVEAFRRVYRQDQP